MSELVCCEFCGRDTTNKSKICRRCMSGIRLHTAKESEPNRKFYGRQEEDDEMQLSVMLRQMGYEYDPFDVDCDKWT